MERSQQTQHRFGSVGLSVFFHYARATRATHAAN